MAVTWCHSFMAPYAFSILSVLDGIGKGLDPRFDITEIAKPWVFSTLVAFHVLNWQNFDMAFSESDLMHLFKLLVMPWSCSDLMKLVLKYLLRQVNVWSIIITYMVAPEYVYHGMWLFHVHFIIPQDARKRWDRQSRAFYNVFRQPDRVEKLAQIIERLVSTTFFGLFSVVYSTMNSMV